MDARSSGRPVKVVPYVSAAEVSSSCRAAPPATASITICAARRDRNLDGLVECAQAVPVIASGG